MNCCPNSKLLKFDNITVYLIFKVSCFQLRSRSSSLLFYSKSKEKKSGKCTKAVLVLIQPCLSFFISFLKTIIIILLFKEPQCPLLVNGQTKNGRKEVAAAQHVGISGHLCVHRDFKPARARDLPSSTFWTQ